MKLKKKLMATILTVIMLMSYVSTLGNAVIAVTTNLAEQNSKTNNTNVEFNSYFEGEEYSKTFEIGKEAKLYLKIKVSNTGYLKNGIVQLSNTNFEIDSSNLKNDKVQSSSKNEIKLKQINNSSSETIIEVPITMIKGDSVDSDLFSKITTVTFTGTYIDENGKEKPIEKEIKNEVKWKGTAEIELAGEISKFLPYEIGEEKGVLIQAKVKSGVKNNSLPIASTKLEINLPELKVSAENSVKPTRVTVIANTTAGTNGKESNEFGISNEANYTYNDETGNIEINVTNKEENGKISWKKTTDEYIVSYFYTGEEIYNSIKEQLELASKTIKTDEEKEAGQVNENALTGEINVKANIEVYNSEETKIEKSEKISYSVEKATGAMADSSISSVSEISKGYIYANYAKAEKEANKETVEAKKDTNYEVSYTAKVYDATMVEAVEFETVAEKYIDSDEKEYSGETSNYSKTVKIDEAIFNKMLGENGKIEITNKSGKTLGKITKESEKDNKGNYIVNISEAKENVLVIKTSKPVIEGSITVVVEKAISSNQNYTKEEMESFEKITLGVITKTYASIKEVTDNEETTTKLVEATEGSKNTQIKLTEPVSKAEISINAENLSTVVKNENVELRAVLDTSSVENALYKNPIFKIVLPENIETVKLNSVDLLLDDELKIKETQLTEQSGRKVILIALEGTQTKYMDNNTSNEKNVIAKGANIVIKADITFKQLAPSANANILLYYTNENSSLYEKAVAQNSTRSTRTATSDASNLIGLATTGVEVVSPNGVVAENHMSGYDGSNTISNITTDKQEDKINVNEEAKEVTIGGIVVNNYANSIDNILVLGRIPFSGNKQIGGTAELGSNFTMKMKSKITISDIDSSKVKVYYSTNGEATKDLENTENGWTENPSSLSEVKSYLIVITGDLETGTQFSFNYKTELPANLDYDSSSYTTYTVYYNNKMDGATLGETKVAGLIGLTTGSAPDISVELTSTVDTVREGQIVKMKATVKNTGSQTVKNVKVSVPLPENATFMEYVEGNGFYSMSAKSQVLTVGNIEAGKSKQVIYFIKFDDKVIEDEIEVDEDTAHESETETETYPKEITHKVTVTADDITGSISSNEYKFNVQEGKIAIDIYTATSESQVLKKGEILEYGINLTRISTTENLSNTVVTIQLPKGTKYKSAEVRESWSANEGTTEGITYNEKDNTVTINIGTLSYQKFILLNVEIEEFSGSLTIMAKAKADGTEEHYSNVTEYMSEIAELEVSELTSTPKYVKEKEDITYTLTITNKGNSIINGVTITDVLPEGVTFEKATYNYAGKEQLVNYLVDGKVELSINQMSIGESITIKLIAKANILPDKNDKEVKNNITVVADSIESKTTNTVTNVIEYYQEVHNQISNENPLPTDDYTQEGRYKITGTAWVDSNKDGKRDEAEELLSDIQVMLIYKSSSELVKDVDTGETKIVTTNSNGQYEFSNLVSDEYLVIFLYDAGKYSITEYQVNSVDESYNSDAINMKIVLNGEQRYAGVTDTIKVTNSNMRDIDIGLYVAEKFDLRLDKYITKVTVTTPSSGIKTYNYNNSKLTKRDIYSKDVNESSLVIEYKIVVTNEGQIPGYVKKIIDYLPDDTKFSTELNKDWYISDNNRTVYNTALANEKIEPGQSKEVSLILSLNITDKNIGTMVNNNAEIYESYNDQGIQDYDSQEANRLESEDDMSSADVMISIATGKIIIYTTLMLAIAILLVFGIIAIKKNVLDKKNN